MPVPLKIHPGPNPQDEDEPESVSLSNDLVPGESWLTSSRPDDQAGVLVIQISTYGKPFFYRLNEFVEKIAGLFRAETNPIDGECLSVKCIPPTTCC